MGKTVLKIDSELQYRKLSLLSNYPSGGGYMHGAFCDSEQRQRDSYSVFGDSSGILQGVQNEAVARLRDSRDSFATIMHDGKNST